MKCSRINKGEETTFKFKRETWLEWFCFDLSNHLLYDEKRTYRLPKWYVPCRIKYWRGDVVQCWHVSLFIFVVVFVWFEELFKFNRLLNFKRYFRWIQINTQNYKDIYPELPYLTDEDFSIISPNKS